MAADGLVLVEEVDTALAVLTIDRPDSKNAFTSAMWTAGADALRRVATDDRLHALLLTATGDVFSAGADIRDFQPGEEAGRPFHSFLDELVAFPKPVVAAVNGAAVGSGFTMLAYADIVIASTAARFKAPFVAMGLAPEAGSSRTLPQLLGAQAAADLMFTSGWLGADEAFRLGFVREVVAPDDLQARAHEKALAVAAMPLASLVATKQLLLAARTGADEARRRESEVFRRLLAEREASS